VKAVQRTQYASLEVVRLGRAEWRVSEASATGRLLGFIERQKVDRFEIVWMSDPLRWGYVGSFDTALEAFADAERFSGETFAARVVPSRRATARLSQAVRDSSASRHTRRRTWVGRDDRSGVA
jgi:hypothetical protein